MASGSGDFGVTLGGSGRARSRWARSGWARSGPGSPFRARPEEAQAPMPGTSKRRAWLATL
eukprot:scaffold52518_cov57-Phaeocystis_antarctica.AAC.2